MTQKVAPLLFALLFAAAPALAGEPHAPAGEYASPELMDYVAGANRLEGRIRAPCCWNQTLDIHGSEVSNELRREIRRRLKAGESADAIEQSLVARYGERILAVPPGSALKGVAIALSFVMAAAGVGGFFMLRRWRERGQAKKTKSEKEQAGAASDSAYDAKLDAELRALDD